MPTAAELRQRFQVPATPVQEPRPGISAPSAFATPFQTKPAISVPDNVATPITNFLRTTFKIPAPKKEEEIVGPMSVAPKTSAPSMSSTLREFYDIKPPEPTPFQKNLQEKVSGGIKKVGEALDKFTKEQGTVIKEFTDGKYKVSASDVAQGLKDTAIGGLNTIGFLAQGFNEGVVRIGKSAIQTATGSDFTEEPKSMIGRTLKAFERDVTGRDRVDTYQEIFKSAEKWAGENDATPEEAKGFAGIAVLGLLFADNPIVGPAKAPVTLTKKGIKELIEAETDDAVEGILRRENPNLAPDVISYIAPSLRQATSEQEVATVVRTANKAAERSALSARQGTQEVTPEDLVRQAADTEQRLTELETTTPSEFLDIPEPLRPLAEEARKYKSAEEFYQRAPSGVRDILRDNDIKGREQVGTFWEESTKDMDTSLVIDSLNPTGSLYVDYKPQERAKARLGENIRTLAETSGESPDSLVTIYRGAPALQEKINPGDFISTDYNSAKSYIGSGGRVLEMEVRRGDVLDDVTEPLGGDYLYRPGADKEVATNKATKGGDKVAPPTQIEIETPRTVSPTLLKRISDNRDPYAVLQLVEKEFPNLSGKVLDTIVTKLSRARGIRTMESLLNMAESMNKRFDPKALKASEPRLNIPALEQANIPKETRKVLSQSGKLNLANKIVRLAAEKLEDPRAAVAAEQEFNRIWDDIDSSVIEKYENLRMEVDVLDNVMMNESAQQLYNKYYKRSGMDAADPTETLEEIMGRAQNKAKENRARASGRGTTERALKLTKLEEKATDLDTEIEYLGYADFDEAQTAVEEYVRLLKYQEELKKEIKDLKPRVKEAQLLMETIQDVAVIPQKEVTAIDRLTDPRRVIDSYKDISRTEGFTTDVYRIFKDFFGKYYPMAKEAILDPFDDAKGRFVDVNKELAQDLKEGVTERFGFTRGSKESQAIMDWGEKDITDNVPGRKYVTEEQLIEDFGREKAKDIMEAERWFRKEYESLIDRINEVRKRIYPNNASKLVAYRKDYFRHYQEIGESFQDALKAFFDTPAGIDPKLVGQSEFTQAKTKFLPFAQAREGQRSVRDAIGGFIDYVPLFAYAEQIDPQIQNFRYLHRRLSESAPRAGEDLMLPNGTMFKHPGIDVMLNFLKEFQRDLTGNTNPMDRFVQDWMIPGGRKTVRLLRFANNRVKANTLGANFGSALGQIAGLPAGIADTKQYFPLGVKRSLAGIFTPNEAMEKSVFIKERYMQGLKDQFPVKFSDKPYTATKEGAEKVARWMMSTMDEIGTKTIWNAEYEKAARNGKKYGDPIRYADDRTRKIVAGRGIGEVPLYQKALITQYAAPFTLEVGNTWWVMRDWMKEKDLSIIATFLIASYAFNEFSERTRGSRVSIDPINSLLEGSLSFAKEYKAGNYQRGAVKFLGRQVGEVLANVPFGQQVAAGIPEKTFEQFSTAVTGAPMSKQEVFGNSAGRYGTPLLLDALNPSEVLYRVLPPVGGRQIQKTIEGIQSLARGYAEGRDGERAFDLPFNAENVVKALLFGSNSTSNARAYFDERNDLFSRVDRQAADNFMRSVQAEKELVDIKELAKKNGQEAAKARLAEIKAEDPLLAKKIVEARKDEQLGLTKNDRLVKMLGVENGERAQYVVEQLRELKTPEERSAYWKYLGERNLLPKKVKSQVKVLGTDIVKTP